MKGSLCRVREFYGAERGANGGAHTAPIRGDEASSINHFAKPPDHGMSMIRVLSYIALTCPATCC